MVSRRRFDTRGSSGRSQRSFNDVWSDARDAALDWIAPWGYQNEHGFHYGVEPERGSETEHAIEELSGN